MFVAIHVSVLGLYRPPVLAEWRPSPPPQTIISLPVQTAVWSSRADGALVGLVAVQLFVLGLYLPPVFRRPLSLFPPQTIISVPVHSEV